LISIPEAQEPPLRRTADTAAARPTLTKQRRPIMLNDSENLLEKAIDRWENEGGALRPVDELTLARRLVAPRNEPFDETLPFLRRQNGQCA
jgi:hypothetical protein